MLPGGEPNLLARLRLSRTLPAVLFAGALFHTVATAGWPSLGGEISIEGRRVFICTAEGMVLMTLGADGQPIANVP